MNYYYYISRESWTTRHVLWSRGCVCVCLSVRGHMPTLLHGPGCNLGSGRGCPLVVHGWTDLQSMHGLRCYGNITRTLVTTANAKCLRCNALSLCLVNYKHWDSAYLRQGTSYQCRDTDPDRHQNLIICSLAYCQLYLKISCKSVLKFLRKVASRQTDKQRRLHILLGGGKNILTTVTLYIQTICCYIGLNEDVT